MDRLITQLGQSRVILGFIIVIGLIMGYLNYTESEELVLIQQSTMVQKGDLDSFRDFVLDLSVLEDENYKALQLFGENPVKPSVSGERRNPFAKF